MLKTLLRTNTVYIFAIQLIIVLVATHVICTDFNYSYYLAVYQMQVLRLLPTFKSENYLNYLTFKEKKNLKISKIVHVI